MFFVYLLVDVVGLRISLFVQVREVSDEYNQWGDGFDVFGSRGGLKKKHAMHELIDLRSLLFLSFFSYFIDWIYTCTCACTSRWINREG